MHTMTSLPAVKPVLPPASLRVIDAHSLPRRRSSKAARACDGADILDGYAALQNLTLGLVAQAERVSVSSLVAARRLTPAQRDAVRGGERPLVLKPAPMPSMQPATPPPPPVTMDAHAMEQRLLEIADELGIDRLLNVLATAERERRIAA
jgi:hypothetical protein